VANLGVNDYLSFSINGLVELPAYLITWFCLDKIGRRWSLFFTMVLGGLACIATSFFPQGAFFVIAIPHKKMGSYIRSKVDHQQFCFSGQVWHSWIVWYHLHFRG